MRFFATVVASGLVMASSSLADKAADCRCPTITSTAGVCQTCITKACLAISTISNPTDCTFPIATQTVSYPCADKKCPEGCGSTSYVVVGSTPGPDCPTVTSTATVCSTCTVKACLEFSTISNPNGCPPSVPTDTISYPCGGKTCPTGCASTSYVYVGPTPV